MSWKNNPEAVAILVRMYPDHTPADIAVAIGFPCTLLAASKKAQELRLEKSDKFFARHKRCGQMKKRNLEPEQFRITHPKPGVTIHRLL